jgi:hypothetical protein
MHLVCFSKFLVYTNSQSFFRSILHSLVEHVECVKGNDKTCRKCESYILERTDLFQNR